jgi:roadblock/LC7 domain-containing protein
MTAPFYAKDFSVEARTFLYICAFWTVAADEELTAIEQEWLVDQFGQDGATKSLDEYLALESSAFLKAFDSASRALTDDDKRAIFPQLEEWLMSCADADGPADKELAVIKKIKNKLSLDPEIRRLTRAGEIEAEAAEEAAEEAAQTDKSEDATQILKGHSGEVTCIDMSPGAEYIFSGSEDCTVKCWDFATRTELRTFEGHEMGITCARFCAGGSRAISGDRMASFRMWDIQSGEMLWVRDQKHNGGATGLDVSPDGKRIVTCSDVGMITFMRAADGVEIATFGEKKNGALHAIRFSPDGKMLVTGGDGKLVRLWDADKCVELKAMRGHTDGVMAVCFSPDGKYVATGGRDNCVKIWDIAGGKMMRNLAGHTFSVMGVNWSPDGKWLLSASWDHTMKVWDIESGRQMFNLEATGSRFSCAVFHPDGTHIIAGCSDKSVYVVKLS